MRTPRFPPLLETPLPPSNVRERGGGHETRARVTTVFGSLPEVFKSQRRREASRSEVRLRAGSSASLPRSHPQPHPPISSLSFLILRARSTHVKMDRFKVYNSGHTQPPMSGSKTFSSPKGDFRPTNQSPFPPSHGPVSMGLPFVRTFGINGILGLVAFCVSASFVGV